MFIAHREWTYTERCINILAPQREVYKHLGFSASQQLAHQSLILSSSELHSAGSSAPQLTHQLHRASFSAN